MKWISVKESMPSLHKATCEDGNEYLASVDVLVFCTDDYGNKREIVAVFEQDDTGYFYTGWIEASDGTKLNSVTHWMPLPAPPKD